jgi:hypothetical protein
MTISREEFLRILPGAVGATGYRASGPLIEHEGSGCAWRIELAPMPELRIGLLALARHRVTIAFKGGSAADRAAFLARFELHFRRGGG